MGRLFTHAAQGALALGIAAGILSLGTSAAGPQPPGTVPERFRKWSAQMEARGLAEPFTGVTTNGTPVAGLFPVRSTGVSTRPVLDAARAFLAALTPEQRARTTFPVDDVEWRKWANQHLYVRQGVGFLEMTEAQREAAFGLLKASLSAKGLTLTRDIMRLNHTLAELNGNNFEEYGEWRYWITVMGTPSETEPWGWQLDGHHAIYNYFVLGDQVVMTPSFVGSEPVTATSGKYAGTSVLQEEQARGLAFMNALDAGARAKALLSGSKPPASNLTEAFHDNVVLDHAGVRADALSPALREQLMGLVGLFVGTLRDGHARVKMEEVRAHLDRTHFAWIGGTGPDAVFYFRIHSPVILIEFDHQGPIGLPDASGGARAATRQHIHVVVRTPNGNDYGKDLLRQHYAQHPHDAPR